MTKKREGDTRPTFGTTPPPPPPIKQQVVTPVAPVVSTRTSTARQADQNPVASIDQTWTNLHPERIWPD